ncbi:MAG: hypothetical protein GMKNLPBB_03223 [Myxococcota bacterium]|nr:hypothetical protein [Myxococcota bacterium]
MAESPGNIKTPGDPAVTPRGLLISATGTFFFALCGIIARLGYSHGATPAGVAVIQALLAFPLALIAAGGWRSVRGKELRNCFVLAVMGGLGGMFLLEGYGRLGVTTTTLIFSCYPLLVGLFEWFFAGRRPQALWFVFFALALAGVAIAIEAWRGVAALSLQYLFPVAACLSVAALDLLGQRIAGAVAPRVSTIYVTLFNIPLMGALYNTRALPELTQPASLITGAALGLFSMLAMRFKLTGISMVGAVAGSLVSTSQPAWALGLSVLVLKESTGLPGIAGVLITMGSIAGMIWTNRRGT